MTKAFEGKEFRAYRDRPWFRPHIFSDLEFRGCSFVSSSISITESVRLRSTVRNVRLIDCDVGGCFIYTAIVEDVIVEGLRTFGLFQSFGAVYKHVTLRGKIGELMVSPCIRMGKASVQVQNAFDEANAGYYAATDWALDISEAQFTEAPDIRRVPASLIRRDPETQIVVTRKKALEGSWRNLDLSGTYWGGWIDLFLNDQDLHQYGDDVILAAPKASRNFNVLLDGLKILRDAGVAEPD